MRGGVPPTGPRRGVESSPRGRGRGSTRGSVFSLSGRLSPISGSASTPLSFGDSPIRSPTGPSFPPTAPRSRSVSANDFVGGSSSARSNHGDPPSSLAARLDLPLNLPTGPRSTTPAAPTPVVPSLAQRVGERATTLGDALPLKEMVVDKEKEKEPVKSQGAARPVSRPASATATPVGSGTIPPPPVSTSRGLSTPAKEGAPAVPAQTSRLPPPLARTKSTSSSNTTTAVPEPIIPQSSPRLTGSDAMDVDEARPPLPLPIPPSTSPVPPPPSATTSDSSSPTVSLSSISNTAGQQFVTDLALLFNIFASKPSAKSTDQSALRKFKLDVQSRQQRIQKDLNTFCDSLLPTPMSDDELASLVKEDRIDPQISPDMLRTEFAKKLEEMETTLRGQMEEQRAAFEDQINELKDRYQLPLQSPSGPPPPPLQSSPGAPQFSPSRSPRPPTNDSSSSSSKNPNSFVTLKELRIREAHYQKELGSHVDTRVKSFTEKLRAELSKSLGSNSVVGSDGKKRLRPNDSMDREAVESIIEEYVGKVRKLEAEPGTQLRGELNLLTRRMETLEDMEEVRKQNLASQRSRVTKFQNDMTERVNDLEKDVNGQVDVVKKDLGRYAKTTDLDRVKTEMMEKFDDFETIVNQTISAIPKSTARSSSAGPSLDLEKISSLVSEKLEAGFAKRLAECEESCAVLEVQSGALPDRIKTEVEVKFEDMGSKFAPKQDDGVMEAQAELERRMLEAEDVIKAAVDDIEGQEKALKEIGIKIEANKQEICQRVSGLESTLKAFSEATLKEFGETLDGKITELLGKMGQFSAGVRGDVTSIQNQYVALKQTVEKFKATQAVFDKTYSGLATTLQAVDAKIGVIYKVIENESVQN